MNPKPVIIQSVNSSLNYDLWTPEKFNLHFGRQTSRLVNCMNGFIMSKRPMSDFWDGFEDTDKRITDEDTGEEFILKLKDWPPNAEFRDMLPLWFDDLMQALPLPEYTRYDGSRNLASRLPEFYVRPDLGPKMYCAYGSVLHPDKGTTNLHLDMSDAVNVMIYVGVARKDNKPIETHINEANNTLLKGGCDEDMMARANDTGHKVGALWHIWKAEDADKIRHFLNKVSKERNKRSDANADPIHDQCWYLDENLRTRLEQEYGVKGLAIAQCLGDAILVPAGAPHQVQNIHSCIKVAGEFVSPENVAHCLAMTQQFRNLSKRHNNHEDKLQIKNIIFHTVKDCLSVLVERDYNLFPMPSPPKLVSETISTSIPENTFESKSLSNPLKEEEMDTTETDSNIKPLPLNDEKSADDQQMPFISQTSISETVPIPSEESPTEETPSEESHAIESDAIQSNEKESNSMESDVKESNQIEVNAIETTTDDKTSITIQMSSEQQNETEVQTKESDSPVLAPPPSLSVVIEPFVCSSPDTLGSPPILMPYSDYNPKDCISKS